MEKKNSLWTGQFFMLLLITLLSGAAGQMTVPLVAEYAQTLGANLTLASTTAGLMSMVSLVVCPFAGALADRVNRKWILVFSNLGYAVCLAGHALCTGISGLIVMRLCTGVFFSVLMVTNVAFSASFISRERMGEGLGYVALATIVAQAFGPTVGIWLQERSGHGMSFLVAGAFALLCAGCILLMPYQEEKKPASQRRQVRLKDLFAVEFTVFMLMAFLFSSGNGLVSTYLKIIARERSIANIALFFTMYSAFMVVLRPLTGKLIDTKGVYFILIPSFIFAGLGMVFVGIGNTLGVMILASAFKALGQGSGTPSLQAHCVKTLDKARAGVAASTVMIGQNIGNALAPIIGSLFVDSMGYKGMFCGAGAVMTGLGLMLVALQFSIEKKQKA